jgi:hypothetical protein
MIWLTLVIGLLNLCLGYILAARLGYAPPSLHAAWQALSAQPPQVRAWNDLPTAVNDPASQADQQLAAPLQASLPQQPATASEPPDDVELSVVETWDLTLEQDVPRLAALDAQLRQSDAECDQQMLKTCLAELRQVCESQLPQRGQGAQPSGRSLEALGETGAAEEVINAAIREHLAQAEATLSSLQEIDIQADPLTAGKQLSTEIGRMLSAAKRLHRSLDDALAANEPVLS